MKRIGKIQLCLFLLSFTPVRPVSGEDQADSKIRGLAEELKSPDREDRVWAINALRKSGEGRAVVLLIPLMNDPDPYVRSEARDSARMLTKKGLPFVFDVLRSGTAEHRASAAFLLGEALVGKNVVDPLIQALKDPDAEVRSRAAQALGRKKDERSREVLFEVMEKDEPRVSCFAAVALARMKDPRALKTVLHALKNEDPELRADAAWVVSRIGGESAVVPLARALEDESESVRSRASSSLIEIGDARAVGPLIKALKDESIGVRSDVCEALGKIGDSRAVEPLLEAAKDAELWVRCNALVALGKLKDERAFPVLVEALKKKEYIRAAAVTGLGHFGDKKAIPALIPLLNDSDARTRRETFQSLGELKAVVAVPHMVKCLAEDALSCEYDFKLAVGKIGEPAIPPLLVALGSEDYRIRFYVVEAMRAIRSKKPVGRLIEMLEDEIYLVRSEAVEALREITGKDRIASYRSWKAWFEAGGKEWCEKTAGRVEPLKPKGGGEYYINRERLGNAEFLAFPGGEVVKPGEKFLVNLTIRNRSNVKIGFKAMSSVHIKTKSGYRNASISLYDKNHALKYSVWERIKLDPREKIEVTVDITALHWKITNAKPEKYTDLFVEPGMFELYFQLPSIIACGAVFFETNRLWLRLEKG
jgi:HEAT repeat protein